MQSGRVAFATSTLISGSGFAIAKMMGLSFIFIKYSGFKASFAETPIKQSEPSNASYKVLFGVSFANLSLNSFIPSFLPLKITPLVSHIKQFSHQTPCKTIKFKQAIPAAPAPFTTTLTSSIFLPVRMQALINPARQITAVPCWSS